MLRKAIWQIPLFFTLLIFCTFSVIACSCDGVNYRREFAKAKTVFIGEALEYEGNPNLKQDGLLIVRFKVEKSWKGAKQSEITLPTRMGLVCGFYVEPGKKYLLYAFGKEMYVPTVCSPSRKLVTDEDFQSKQIKQLDSRWFRFFARILPL